MITARGLLYFVIGFLLIGLLILVSGFSAEATCVPGGYFAMGNGGGMPSSTSYIPGYAMPGGFTGSTNFYWYWAGTGAGGCSSTYLCNTWHDSGGGTIKVWRDCYTDGCTGGTTWSTDYSYARYGSYTVSGDGSGHDFDCNGVTDNNQIIYTGTFGPPNPTEKFSKHYKFTNTTTGVSYTVYYGNQGNNIWTSSDGSAIPSDDILATYKITVYGDFPYKAYGDLGIAAGSVVSFTAVPSSGGALFGGDAATATSPGRATGGDSGTSVPSSGSTNDYKEMFDYLQGIQKNAKAIADNQIKIDTDLQQIKQNQAVGAGASGTPPPAVDMSATNTKLDEVKQSVDALKTDMDTEGSTSGLPDGDTSAMNDNSAFSQDEMDTKYTNEKDSLTTYMDSIIFQSNPIVTVATGSGVNDGGGSSSVSVSAGQFGFSLNFSGCESQLDVIGTFFVAFCGLAGFVEILRG